MTIKVLLVEDSPVALTILKRMISTAEDMQIVGTARTGVEALELLPKLKPNIICTDLLMPKMDGLELTQAVMEKSPTPILVISAAVQEEDRSNVFQLLDAGAVDIFPKPRSGQIEDYEAQRDKLLTKIRVLSGVKVFTKRNKGTQLASKTPPPVAIPRTPVAKNALPKFVRVVAIAASTGGPQAFQEVLGALPANFPVPILCVQHISTGFLDGFIKWLDQNCALNICVAKTGEKPQPGHVYFPPEREHLNIDVQGRFYCAEGLPVDGHCPSATTLFQTVAKYYGSAAIGVLLTGMGRDGAAGLLTLKQRGAYTIIQDEATSIVFGMPQEAAKINAHKTVLPLPEVATHLMETVGRSQPSQVL